MSKSAQPGRISSKGFRSGHDKIFSDRIADNSRSMISIINRDFVYEKVNKPFCKAHKGTRKSFIGKSLVEIWGKDIFDQKIRKNIDLGFEGKTVRYEAAFNTPGLEERHFEVVFRPIKTGGKKVTHLMVETFDITELHESKKAADSIRRDMAELEVNFENHLGELGRLETIGSLAGGIAHDFNNILATISGYTEMLQEDLPGEESAKEKTTKILSAVAKARSLTNQILTFSRQVEQEKVPADLNEVLQETVGFIRSTVSSGIVIRAKYCSETPWILADPTQLFRVFLNLMTNAVQSMETNGGTLTISTSIVEGSIVKSILSKDIVADDYIVTRFMDTGRGIDPAFIGRIFEPFFTSREVGKGTGLGLSVVHGIVSDLEGEVIVTSKPGRGSVFDVYLPASRSCMPQEIMRSPKNKILFIKGNRHESKIISIALENSGHEVEFVSDLHQLSGKFSDGDVKPVIVIYMADSEKISIGELRRFYYNHNLDIPCILISDNEKEDIKEELINLGVVRHHLLKPVSLKDLRNAIQISLHK